MGPFLLLGSSDTPGVGALVRSSPSASPPEETSLLVPLPPLALLSKVVAVESWNTQRLTGARPTSGLLFLRAVKRRVGNLTPLKCLVEAVELREDEFAVAVVLGVCGL